MSEKMRIAFQGALGSFSHKAATIFAEHCLKTDAEYDPCQTFGEVYEHVERGEATHGAIPLENSSIGSIVANYDLLWIHGGYIISELMLPVHHQLIGLAGADLNEITEDYSHPAALDQCRKLFKKYPKMTARVYWDTSGAVRYIKELNDPHLAAIAGRMAADEYGMTVLVENIEDFAHNATRFGLFLHTDKDLSKPKGEYKLSAVAEVPHKAGSLAGLLSGLSEHGANLSKIESRPIAETPWHYRFFLDIEIRKPEIEAEVIKALKENSDNVRVLGRYTPCPTAVDIAV